MNKLLISLCLWTATLAIAQGQFTGSLVKDKNYLKDVKRSLPFSGPGFDGGSLNDTDIDGGAMPGMMNDTDSWEDGKDSWEDSWEEDDKIPDDIQILITIPQDGGAPAVSDDYYDDGKSVDEDRDFDLTDWYKFDPKRAHLG